MLVYGCLGQGWRIGTVERGTVYCSMSFMNDLFAQPHPPVDIPELPQLIQDGMQVFAMKKPWEQEDGLPPFSTRCS